MYTGENVVEIKTEADSDDMTECPRDNRPSTGSIFLFFFLVILYSHMLSFLVADLYSCVTFTFPHLRCDVGLVEWNY